MHLVGHCGNDFADLAALNWPGMRSGCCCFVKLYLFAGGCCLFKIAAAL
jgi:hypothetical protein